LAGLEHRLQQREAERKANQVPLCFGSKKLFRAQFHRERERLCQAFHFPASISLPDTAFRWLACLLFVARRFVEH